MALNQRDLDDIRLARALLSSGAGRRLREDAQLSRAEFGEAVGVTGDAVSLWEAGRRSPRTDAARRLGRQYRRLQAAQPPAVVDAAS